MSRAPVDPVELTQALIRRPSVTPADEGAMAVLERHLTDLGFTCRRLAFEGPGGQGVHARIENLYARRGTASPNLCFAGHTDVVPTGPADQWSAQPFEAEVRDGVLYGRGAVDMKGGIAAWVAAVSQVLAEGEPDGSLSFLITGDEEGPALHGTKRVVEALAAEGEVIDGLRGRRTVVVATAGRHDQGRAARLAEHLDYGSRQTGPRRLSRTRGQPRPGHRPADDAAERPYAGRRL